MEDTQWNKILLTDLPVEILELILSSDEISCADVCRFSETCSLFKYVSSSNKLWKLKYKKGWLDSTSFEDGNDIDWRAKYQSRYEFGKLIDSKIDSMSEEFYLQENISNEAFQRFQCHRDESVIAYQTLIDELERILHDGQSSENLTKKYYTKKVLRYIRHLQVKEVWKNFLAEPEQNQCLEIGACLLAQWCQTSRTCCTKQVMLKINTLALNVKKKIQVISPKHPVLQSDLCMQDLSESLWTPPHCRIVLLCINEFLFKEQKFGGNEDEYYCADNTYIDKVLSRKRGIHIVLGILYAAIARRLGVYCQPVNFLGHFLLKWLEHPQLDDDQAFTYIDLHNNGVFRTRRECYSLVNDFQPMSGNWFEPVSPVKLYIRMCWNLVEVGRHLESLGEGPVCLCNALELLSILNPVDTEHKLLLARVYLHLCINLGDVISMIQEVSSHDPTTTGVVSYMYQVALNQIQIQKCWVARQEIVPKLRGENCPVKFAVGMIMKHMKYNYRCVIYAWDSECAASTDWIKQMGVHNLAYKENQPFYHVFANDGSNRYAAQENLELDLERKPIAHNDIGRYFESYRGTHYIPNKQKTLEYPNDALVRESIFSFGEFFTYKDMCNNVPDYHWD